MIKTTTTSQGGILTTGGNSGGFDYYFGIVICDNGQLDFRWVVGGQSDTRCVGAVLNNNIWHTVLVTYDGTTLTLYEDGIIQYVFNPTVGINTIGNNYNYIGKAYHGSNFIGTLKNVMYYDYVITISYALANSYQTAGPIIYNSGN